MNQGRFLLGTIEDVGMNTYAKFAALIATLLIGVVMSPALCAANAVIDVLVVYTKGTAEAYGGDPITRFNQLFQVSNQIYQDSGVSLELRIAKTLEVNYTDNNSADTALNDITYAKHAAFAGVAAAREQAKADMVILYRPFKSVQASCGLAWIGGQGTEGDLSAAHHKKFMFAHIAINSCGDFVTAHELGHNMGLTHSRKQDGKGAIFPYALGYGVVNQFTTIMAYQSEFNVDYWTGKLYKFSNPDISCKGRPCGINRNDRVRGADARYALNIAGAQIANFYAADTASGVSSAVAASAKARLASSSIAAFAVSSMAASSLPARFTISPLHAVGVVASSKSSVASAGSPRRLGAAAHAYSSSPSAAASASAAPSVSNLPSPSYAHSSSSATAVQPIFKPVLNVAQYRGADWANEVCRYSALSLEQAKAIAAADPRIAYFFIVKGASLSLGDKGVFYAGDAVFFSGNPWYGTALDLADAYQK
jgi:peptidyl-Asp metalloendopeptidase